MARPHAAALLEDALNRRVESVLRGRGWRTRLVSHTGYGSPQAARVLGRVLLTQGPADATSVDATSQDAELEEAEQEQRGWRAFVTAPAMNAPVEITLGAATVASHTDRAGLIDLTIAGHGLEPGWHEATLRSPDAEETTAAVLIVDPEQPIGLVSDIDDTVITTMLPRPLIAAWNTFVQHEGARRAVPGMATMYRSLMERYPGAPIVYVSTGAWNTAPTLTRFLKRHGYPLGPLLLTDWGPTNTGWFRSGQEHKRQCLARLARELPNTRWVLIGDDGQHDPKIYGDFAASSPDHVEAIAIRELTPAEQVLSHGLPLSNDEIGEFLDGRRPEGAVPDVRAPDGYGLLHLLRQVLGRAEAREA
ncbi:MAG: DUF2183 domain-containing protein [Micrococcales bacterium]|nr:DUF2183 domain-containing protein [Micrococcales bacterium]